MSLRLEQLQASMWRHTAIQVKPCGSRLNPESGFNYDPISNASLSTEIHRT